MQDLKRNKKRNNHHIEYNTNKLSKEDKIIDEITEELSRGCGYKPKSHSENGCNLDMNCCQGQHIQCDCICHTKPQTCEPCEVDSDICIDNNCGPECCSPITPPRFNVSNSIPYPIEANRVYDTMVFQTFTDAVAPNGAPLVFEYDVVEVNGSIPRVGQVNVNIEKICMNYSGVIIDTGCTTLEDYDLQALEPTVGRRCETSFEYAVCGERNTECCSQGKGKSVVYKQRGLSILVEDLVLELRGKCGCTEFTAYAYPAVRMQGGQLQRCSDVEFIFNTLSAPVCLPASGKSVILRQNFETNLTVDCIGKALLSYIEGEGCEYYYELCIPNDIDLILCLKNTVSILINEQVVVLGSPNGIDPRVVDTFSKVCDFSRCGDQG